VKGRCPRPLDDGDVRGKHTLCIEWWCRRKTVLQSRLYSCQYANDGTLLSAKWIEEHKVLEKTHSVHELIQRITLGMERINNLLSEGTIKVPVHLAFGHEPIASALVSAMRKKDGLFLPHRNIHYQLAAEPHMDSIIDEILLKETGINRGLSGAMNMCNPQRGIVYSSSILGNNLAVAIGYAKGMKVRSEEAITWVVTGDGAIEEGAWYEATLNATSLNLGCIFVVENNGWSLATSIEQRRRNFDLASYAKFLDVPYLCLEGNIAEDYLSRLNDLRAEMEVSGSPAIVEVILETLGGYDVIEDSGTRFVNYHAGGIKNFSPMRGNQ
jgi:TPP-dependent pyruvate/acetoin dehydrogenase alpha subunit